MVSSGCPQAPKKGLSQLKDRYLHRSDHPKKKLAPSNYKKLLEKEMSHQFDTTIVVNDAEIPVNVVFDYEPEQYQTRDDPGYPASIEIESVSVGSEELPRNIVSCFESMLEEEAYKYIENITECDRLDYADYLYDQQKHAA